MAATPQEAIQRLIHFIDLQVARCRAVFETGTRSPRIRENRERIKGLLDEAQAGPWSNLVDDCMKWVRGRGAAGAGWVATIEVAESVARELVNWKPPHEKDDEPVDVPSFSGIEFDCRIKTAKERNEEAFCDLWNRAGDSIHALQGLIRQCGGEPHQRNQTTTGPRPVSAKFRNGGRPPKQEVNYDTAKIIEIKFKHPEKSYKKILIEEFGADPNDPDVNNHVTTVRKRVSEARKKAENRE